MSRNDLYTHLAAQADQMREAGTFKTERVLESPQAARIRVADGREVINMCANNYLGLANHPEVVAAARESLDTWGYGLASVRFICGTQALHKELEERISRFVGRTTRSSTTPAGTPTAASLRRFSGPKTPLSPMSSITRASSTVSGSARPAGFAIATTT